MANAEFELAMTVLDTSIKVISEVQNFLDRYRGALRSLEGLTTSVAVASCKAEQFYSALRSGDIPSQHHSAITRAIEILTPKLDELNALLKRYPKDLRSIDKVHWATFGERRAKGLQLEIENWNRNVFELVVATLLANRNTTNNSEQPTRESVIKRY